MSEIKESINKKGQLEIEISHFENEWEKKNNGKYVLDTVGWQHREMAIKYISMLQGNKGIDINKTAEEVVKARNDGKTRVKDVIEMLKNNGEGLTDDEKTMFNDAASGFDISGVYGDDATEVIFTFLVDAPIPHSNIEELEKNLDLGVGTYLIDKCLLRLATKFQLDPGREKKS